MIFFHKNVLLIMCVWFTVSPYGKIKLGRDDDEPE
ncbi:MAG TPA: hypothetical protein ENK36_08425 [Desulfobacterales bacterium]|nr:hypothetical protein [Desulfobacterales bacterium]